MALQVLALFVATGIFVTAHWMKFFTTVGSSTPLIPAVATHVVSYAGLSLAIVFVKLPLDQTTPSGSSCRASTSASHLVRSVLFRITGGRWGSRQSQHVLVVRVRPASNGSNNTRRRGEAAKSPRSSGISLPGVRSSIVPTVSER